MAFGIDDALTTAAAGISLGDTLVEIIKRYRRQKNDYDLDILIEEIAVTALKRIKESERALLEFKDLLVRRDVDTSMTLQDVVDKTPFWNAVEQYRLAQIRKQFSEFVTTISSSTDDIAALVRCRGFTEAFGNAVSATVKTKRRFLNGIHDAQSLEEAIALLEEELDRQKSALQGGAATPMQEPENA